jgi:hypothetical protein
MKPPAKEVNLAEHRDNFLKQGAALNRHAVEALNQRRARISYEAMVWYI